MKKCIVCVALLCLILTACATVAQPPATTTVPQMNGTTTAATNPTTLSTTMRAPTTNQGYPPCLNGGHVYEDGICKYCKKPANIVRIVSGERSIAPVGGILVKKTYGNGQWPTAIHPPLLFANYMDSQIPSIQRAESVQLQLAENVELAGAWMQRHTTGEQTAITLQQLSELYPGTYYIGVALVQKDNFVAGDWETTTYQFGFKLVVPDSTVTTTQPTTNHTAATTTMRPAYLCAVGDHEIKDGYCIHCGRVEPKDVDGKLIVNGKDITAGNYVKVNEGHNNSKLPLTAILTELGIDWVWESDTVLRIDVGSDGLTYDLNEPAFGWPIPPGTLGGVRWVVDGEVIVDGNSLELLLRKLDIIMTTDYDTNTVLIARVMP